jgi:hypothetical protein
VLLNSNTPAAHELMRADWAPNELRRKDAAAWHFLETEVRARARRGAAAR